MSNDDEAGGLYMQYLTHAGPDCLIVLYERYSINGMMAVKACNNSTAVVFFIVCIATIVVMSGIFLNL